MCSLTGDEMNDRKQAEGCNSSQNTMQSNKMFVTVSTTDKYRAEELRYLWCCGTKKYRKGDGTGTIEKCTTTNTCTTLLI